jgi:hypothetical protein
LYSLSTTFTGIQWLCFIEFQFDFEYFQWFQETFDFIDSILLLNEKGKLKFFGNAQDSLKHFNFKPSIKQLFSLSSYLKVWQISSHLTHSHTHTHTVKINDSFVFVLMV